MQTKFLAGVLLVALLGAAATAQADPAPITVPLDDLNAAQQHAFDFRDAVTKADGSGVADTFAATAQDEKDGFADSAGAAQAQAQADADLAADTAKDSVLAANTTFQNNLQAAKTTFEADVVAATGDPAAPPANALHIAEGIAGAAGTFAVAAAGEATIFQGAVQGAATQFATDAGVAATGAQLALKTAADYLAANMSSAAGTAGEDGVLAAVGFATNETGVGLGVATTKVRQAASVGSHAFNTSLIAAENATLAGAAVQAAVCDNPGNVVANKACASGSIGAAAAATAGGVGAAATSAAGAAGGNATDLALDAAGYGTTAAGRVRDQALASALGVDAVGAVNNASGAAIAGKDLLVGSGTNAALGIKNAATGLLGPIPSGP